MFWLISEFMTLFRRVEFSAWRCGGGG